MKYNPTIRRRIRAAAVTAAAVAAVVGATAATSSALIAPGTPGHQVQRGLDNDNAANPFIQPPGVAAKQHMDNTDVLFGRDGNDLLIGNLGGDTLLAAKDATSRSVGRRRARHPTATCWPGTGQRRQHLGARRRQRRLHRRGGQGHMVFAPFVKDDDGDLLLTVERTEDPAGRHRRPAGSSAARSSRCRSRRSSARSSWSGSTSTASQP